MVIKNYLIIVGLVFFTIIFGCAGEKGPMGPAGPIGPPGSPGVELYYDNFSDPTLSTTWVTSASTGLYSINNGKLQIACTSDTYMASAKLNLPSSIDNCQIECDTYWISGVTDNSYGIFFRDSGGNNQYRFCISGSGGYIICTGINPLVNWTADSIIHSMGWNRLKVVCLGTQLDFYINDKLISTLDDATFSTGTVTLAVGGIQTIQFDNFRIYVWEKRTI